MAKRAIPQVPKASEDRARFDQALAENLQILMGQRGGKIEPLAATATTAQIIAKINEIIDRLQ